MYCNPAYDKLVADSLKELDFNKRLTLMHDAERIALKDAPYLITAHDNVIAVTRNDTWEGYVHQPDDHRRAVRLLVATAAADQEGVGRRRRAPTPA